MVFNVGRRMEDGDGGWRIDDGGRRNKEERRKRKEVRIWMNRERKRKVHQTGRKDKWRKEERVRSDEVPVGGCIRVS